MSDSLPVPSDLASLARRLMITANVFGAAIWLAILSTSWGDVEFAWALPLLWAGGVIANATLVAFAIPRVGFRLGEDLRAACNVVLHIPVCALCQWTFSAWLLVPFLTGFATSLPADRVSLRVLLMLLGFDAAAAATGARWHDILAFSGISLFIHIVLALYLRLAYDLLRANERALTELRAAQRVAIAQEKLASIGQIAAGVAHEINNPMCFVTANVAELLNDLKAAPALPAELADYREHILPETLDGIARVNSIVDDLRRFARGEPERFVGFDLADEIQAAVRMARTQLRPGQRLSLGPLPRMRMVGMPRQLCQVVLNLIINGLQALGDRGEVQVSASQLADGLMINVSDDGAGMSEDTRRRLFQPFFTTKREQGLGIGLAVVHDIVKVHGGTLEVESELGRGSAFHIILPQLADPEVNAREREPPRAAPRSASAPSPSGLAGLLS